MDNVASINIFSVTLCRRLCLQQVTYDLVNRNNEVVDTFTSVKPLDTTFSNSRSLSCVTTRDSETCTVCGTPFSFRIDSQQNLKFDNYSQGEYLISPLTRRDTP